MTPYEDQDDVTTVAELTDLAKSEFGFLAEAGALLTRSEIVFPDSFKGGFVISYALDDTQTRLRLQYLDMEFEAWLDERQLFGSEVHSGFAGNMFSREHLAESLPRLAIVVRESLGGR